MKTLDASPLDPLVFHENNIPRLPSVQYEGELPKVRPILLGIRKYLVDKKLERDDAHLDARLDKLEHKRDVALHVGEAIVLHSKYAERDHPQRPVSRGERRTARKLEKLMFERRHHNAIRTNIYNAHPGVNHVLYERQKNGEEAQPYVRMLWKEARHHNDAIARPGPAKWLRRRLTHSIAHLDDNLELLDKTHVNRKSDPNYVRENPEHDPLTPEGANEPRLIATPMHKSEVRAFKGARRQYRRHSYKIAHADHKFRHKIEKPSHKAENLVKRHQKRMLKSVALGLEQDEKAAEKSRQREARRSAEGTERTKWYHKLRMNKTAPNEENAGIELVQDHEPGNEEE